MKKTIMVCVVVLLFLIALNFANKRNLDFEPINKEKVEKVEKTIETLNPKIDNVVKKQVAIAIADHSEKYNVPYQKLVAIACIESGFNPLAVRKNKNGTKDSGVMQINDCWNGKLGIETSKLSNAYYSVESACKIIKYLESCGYSDISFYHSLDSLKRRVYKKKINSVLSQI